MQWFRKMDSKNPASEAEIRTGDYLALKWKSLDPFERERTMVRSGGYIIGNGVRYGNGIDWHYKEAMKCLWPRFAWHKWSNLLIPEFARNKETGVMGPASSGKTYCAAAYGLTKLFIWPQNTSVIMSTTTTQGLQLRVWGSVKELFNSAKMRRPHLPGRIIESRYMLTMADAEDDAQDYRDGIIGVACKVGGQFVGLSNYVGLKNDRVVLIADEASLMARGFLDSVANLRKNPDFQLIALGNPKDQNDALGIICEPHPSAGGWDGLGYEERTRVWNTRSIGGRAIQICGYDSPNYDYPRGLNPFPWLIKPEDIDNDLAYYGRDSLQFSMMNLGCMPKTGGSRRVVTLSSCEANRAFEEAVWLDVKKLTRVIAVDAAYSGVGGDRCSLTDLTFGPLVDGTVGIALTEPQAIVPVSPKTGVEPEEQIASWVKSYAESRGIAPENVGFDSTGRGTLMSAFARLWSPMVVPIEFGGLPSDSRAVREGDPKTEREAYGKNVTALWFASRLVVEGKQIRQLSRECAEEGASREWGINKNGKVDVETKDITKLRMGRSPDLWDSLVAAIEVARRRGFKIASGAGVGVVTKRATPEWLKKKATMQRDLSARHTLTSV